MRRCALARRRPRPARWARVTALIPGIIVLALYAGVRYAIHLRASAKERHVDRVKILDDFEREISRRR